MHSCDWGSEQWELIELRPIDCLKADKQGRSAVPGIASADAFSISGVLVECRLLTALGSLPTSLHLGQVFFDETPVLPLFGKRHSF